MPEKYDSDEYRNLISSGHEDVDISIEAQLTALLSFDSIYSRQTHNDKVLNRQFPHHDFKLLFEDFSRARRENIKARRKESHSRAHQQVSTRAAQLNPSYQAHELISNPPAKRDVILVTVTVVTIATSAIALGLALHYSTNN